MTAADLLRRAAGKLRETAQAATPGPWEDGDHIDGETYHRYGDYGFYLTGPVGSPEFEDSEQAKADISYCALMHPPVALALADLLDGYAEIPPFAGWDGRHGERLTTLARAILREPEEGDRG